MELHTCFRTFAPSAADPSPPVVENEREVDARDAQSSLKDKPKP